MSFTTIDEYIALQPDELQKKLQNLRQTIQKAEPEAEEVISYQMPAFKLNGILVWFAANKNHIGLYVVPRVKDVFKEKLIHYKQTKSAIHFPLNQPIPYDLVTEIVKYSANENFKKKIEKDKKNNRIRKILTNL